MSHKTLFKDYYNVNGVQSKLDEIESMLNELLFDILFIAEIKIYCTVSENLHIKTL